MEHLHTFLISELDESGQSLSLLS